MCDLRFYDARSFVIMTPETEIGWEWVEDNIGREQNASLQAGNVLIEHRYLEDIVLGARADGLVCEG